MAILLYNNGIIKEYKPSKLTFTEQELINFFDNNFKFLRSKRLIEIPNVWCLWAENENPDPIEFNRLCTDMLDVHVFSHVVFVHDTELDPSWSMHDMIYKDYSEFKHELNAFIDEVAKKLVEESEQIQAEQGQANNMIYLTTAGQTDDLRVIYNFSPAEQSDEFYKDGSFANFSDKILEYLKTNLDLTANLTIFKDKKIVISVNKDDVPNLFNKMIENFESKENYEVCNELVQMLNSWNDLYQIKKKRGRPKKESSDG